MNSSLSHPEPLNFGGLHGSAEKKVKFIISWSPLKPESMVVPPTMRHVNLSPGRDNSRNDEFHWEWKVGVESLSIHFLCIGSGSSNTSIFIAHLFSGGLLDTMQIYQVVCGYFASVMSRVITSIKWPYLGGFQYFCHFHLENRGRWTHLDEHIFQRGGFTTNQSKNGICSMCGIFTTT